MLVMTSMDRNQPLQEGTVLVLQEGTVLALTQQMKHKNVHASSDGGLVQSVYTKKSNAPDAAC